MLAAVEFLDGKCMDLVEQHLGYGRPIQPANFYTLVETSGSHDEHDKEVCRGDLLSMCEQHFHAKPAHCLWCFASWLADATVVCTDLAKC